VYFESGDLRGEVNYKNGKKEGPSKSYYKNGKLSSEQTYRDGKEEGLYREYYENGGLRFIDTYENGQKINRKTYNKLGKLEFDKDYPNMEVN
jgi:antitoxin component YwqK of YwqJK toxin-antitoxin module